MPLFDLPEEILLIILSSLGARDLLTFAAVNRCAKTFFECSSRLQYIAQLDAAGCIDLSLHAPYKSKYTNDGGGGGGDDATEPTLPIAHRLEYLTTREARWRQLDLRKNARHLDLPCPAQVSIYDLSAGVFAYGQFGQEKIAHTIDLREVSRRGEGIVLEDSVNRLPDGALVELPHSDVRWETFIFDGDNGDIADFSLALKEYDLFVLVSYSIKSYDADSAYAEDMQVIKANLYQFSSKSLHPLAKEPMLPIAEKPASYRRPSPIMEVAGKYLIIMLNFPRAVVRNVIEDLYVFNWQTGKLIHHQEYDDETYCSLAFVTPSLFVMPNMEDCSLDLIHIFPAPDGSERVCWLRRLQLPDLVEGFHLRSASCRSDPNPTSSTPDPLNPGGCTPTEDPGGGNVRRKLWGAARHGISADPLRAIISFNFIVMNEDTHGMPFGPSANLVVHRSTLARLALEVLEERKADALSGWCPEVGEDAVPVVRWEDWGPNVTRWRLEDDAVEWVTTTAGQRQVFAGLSQTNPWRPTIVVRDFNPYEVRKAMAKGVGVHVDSRHGELEEDSEDEDVDLSEPGEPDEAMDRDVFEMSASAEMAEVEGTGPSIDAEDYYVDQGLGQAEIQATAGHVEASQNVREDTDESTTDDEDSPDVVPFPDIGDPLVDPVTPDELSWNWQETPPMHVPFHPNNNPIATPAPFPSVTNDDDDTYLRRTSVRVRDKTPKVFRQYFRKGEVMGELPCVEYTIEGDDSLYTGLLMDEERIIGYLEAGDNPLWVDKMKSMAVFSMYP